MKFRIENGSICRVVVVDLLKLQSHVRELVEILQCHRQNCEAEYSVIHKDCEAIADVIDIEISPPRLARKQ